LPLLEHRSCDRERQLLDDRDADSDPDVRHAALLRRGCRGELGRLADDDVGSPFVDHLAEHGQHRLHVQPREDDADDDEVALSGRQRRTRRL
jgi:hypothetical protein